ncbi:MAG: hypothetical protein A3J38_04680 [Gammaproteobacteria bacterium RIFCSPHIGHO2_12_FULL_45_9]|nr:MAG: hypothetical protein A3J38_04680 [Gammaproteobacteria bacterium RIFCSPHIGHO2_12_FULL_45_9]
MRGIWRQKLFSEDLDFAGGVEFKASDLMSMKGCLEAYLGNRYGLIVSVKEPKEMTDDPTHHAIKVDKWQLNVITSPERKDMPQQKIKIEVINVPAYSRVPQALLHNYDFLPDGYSDLLVMVETIEEIMADKLISLVNCSRYIRNRDIWDLRWLKQEGARINTQFIRAKISDYQIINYLEKLDSFLEHVVEIVHGKIFMDEMSRFIPSDVQARTLRQEKFLTFLCNEITQMFEAVRRSLLDGGI